MKQRIVTGTALALLAVGLLGYAPLIALVFVLLGVAIWSYVEFDALFFQVESQIRRFRLVVLMCITILAMRGNVYTGWLTVWGCFVVFCVFQIYHWKGESNFDRAVRAISLEWLGYFYCVGMFGFILPILQLANGRAYLFLLFLIVFGGDTSAYFIGSRFGKHRIAPALSPKKSVEGSMAAIFCAVTLSLGWCYVTQEHWDLKFVLILSAFAVIVSLLAQIGDLFESLLKRSQAQKDSGSLLPGHGGILDRVDGLALSAPAFYFFVNYILSRV